MHRVIYIMKFFKYYGDRVIYMFKFYVNSKFYMIESHLHFLSFEEKKI